MGLVEAARIECMEKSLSTAQAADIIGCHVRHVTHLIATKQLKAFNTGTDVTHGARYRIRPADLERYMASKSTM